MDTRSDLAVLSDVYSAYVQDGTIEVRIKVFTNMDIVPVIASERRLDDAPRRRVIQRGLLTVPAVRSGHLLSCDCSALCKFSCPFAFGHQSRVIGVV